MKMLSATCSVRDCLSPAQSHYSVCRFIEMAGSKNETNFGKCMQHSASIMCKNRRRPPGEGKIVRLFRAPSPAAPGGNSGATAP